MNTAFKAAFRLPLTSRLNPFARNGQNLLYLAKTAALTRVAIGVARVYEESPGKLRDPKLSATDKKKSFYERAFVELFGTAGSLLSLHTGQDLVAKVFERKYRSEFAQLKTQMLSKVAADTSLLESAQKEAIQHAFGHSYDEVFGKNTWGVIDRILNGQVLGPREFHYHHPLTNKPIQFTEGVRSVETTAKSLVGRFEEHLKGKRLKNIVPATLSKELEGMAQPLMKKLNRASSISMLGGAITCALFGGFVIQWVNDQVISKTLDRVFAKPKSQGSFNPSQAMAQSLPQANQARGRLA